MYAGPESGFICSSICKAFELYMFVHFTYLQPYTKLCLIIQKVQKEFVEHFNDFTILCNPESGSKLTEYGSNADPVPKLLFIRYKSEFMFRIQESNNDDRIQMFLRMLEYSLKRGGGYRVGNKLVK